MGRLPSKPLTLPPNASPWQRAIHAFLRAHPEISVNQWATAAGISEGTIRNARDKEGWVMTDLIYRKLNKAAIQLSGAPLRSYDKTKAILVGRVGAGAM